jgi:hypothetical protein
MRRLALVALFPALALANPSARGPSSSEPSYLLPSAPGGRAIAILTVGDGVEHPFPYRLAGVPDGMGAFDNGDGTFTLLVNHELKPDEGIPRAHNLGAGKAGGAFVSRWRIRTEDLRVVEGSDLIRTVQLWHEGRYQHALDPVLNRFCSSDLAAPSAFAWGDLGTSARLYLTGEEYEEGGRGFGVVVTGPEAGRAYELPHLGRISFENIVANPAPQRLTVVACLDDAGRATDVKTGFPSEVYIFVGEKRATGNEVERAGLVNGRLFGVRVEGTDGEDRELGLSRERRRPFARFFLVEMKEDVPLQDHAALQAAAFVQGVTRFQRVEDGHWDPANPEDLYFTTTDEMGGNARLFRLRFDDLARPERGGGIQIVREGRAVDGEMFDNLTVTRTGFAVVQEDPGGASRLARIWLFDLRGPASLEIARFDAARFAVGAPQLVTTDEESSGVIDASELLGPGWMLASVQAHTPAGDPELVQRGQIVALYVPQAVR